MKSGSSLHELDKPHADVMMDESAKKLSSLEPKIGRGSYKTKNAEMRNGKWRNEEMKK